MLPVTSVTPIPKWIKPLVAGVVSGSPILLFDWEELGLLATALRIVVINDGAGPIVVTPEAGYTPIGPAEVGQQAPLAFTVDPGDCYGDPYGIDEMRPFWRTWVDGNSAFRWGIQAIARATAEVRGRPA